MDHSEAHVVMFDRDHVEAQKIKSRSHHKHQSKGDDNSVFFASRLPPAGDVWWPNGMLDRASGRGLQRSPAIGSDSSAKPLTSSNITRGTATRLDGPAKRSRKTMEIAASP